MSQSAKPWLPSAASAELAALLAKVTSPWLARWLSGGAALQVTPATRSALRQLAWFGDTGAQVGCEVAARGRFGQALCAGLAEPDNPIDMQVAEQMVGAACTDLAITLGAAQDAAGQNFGPIAPAFETCFLAGPDSREWSLAVALSAPTLARLRQGATRSGYRPELGSLAKALAPVQCRLGFHLGQAGINGSDLSSLEPGDVIAFDSRTDWALPMMVEGLRTKQGSARLSRLEAGLSVTIAAPVSLDAKGVES